MSAAAAGAGAALIAVLVLLPSGVGAVTPTVFHAPYTGSPDINAFLVSNGCAVKLTTSHAAAFGVATGRASVSQKVTGKPCGIGPGGMDSIRSISTVGYAGSPFSVATSGKHTATVKWTLSFSDNLTLTQGNFSQQVLLDASVAPLAEIMDLTNGTAFTSNSPWLISNISTHGTSAYHAIGLHLVFTVNATLSSSHKYEFVVGISVIEFVQLTDTGSSFGSVSVNMATLGNGAKLTSLSIA
ncbi:MAG TPA: hypothetical protein VGV89_10095 [Thermoplasmata archaeon]|nr:hypothetical protein [Thermoplasmata archaeon]